MKQEEVKYEKWLNAVRSQQPTLEHPEELTREILNRIPQTASQRKPKMFLIGAWISGVAATLLILFCINTTYPLPTSSKIEYQKEKSYEYDQWRNNSHLSLPAEWKEMELSEKNSYLISRYVKHRKIRQESISNFIKANRLK